MPDGSQPLTKTTARDDAYFLEPIFFKVEGTIFQVPQYQFANSDSVFSTIFTLPPGDGVDVEGSSEARPFELLGILKADFTAFLRAIYPLDPLAHTNSDYLTPTEWISVLALSDMWGFQRFRMLATEKLGALSGSSPADKILWGEQYRMPAWVVRGCLDFINREEGMQLDDMEKLGLAKTMHIYNLREMRLKRQIGVSERDCSWAYLELLSRRDIEELFGVGGPGS